MASSGREGSVRTGSAAASSHLSDRIPVVVGRGQRFDGLLTFSGSARVEGEFRGEVVSSGTLLLGEEADVRARIEVDELVVAGRLEGDATARRRIELLPTARVRGQLQAPRVALADGCLVRGRCLTESPVEPLPPPADVKLPAAPP